MPKQIKETPLNSSVVFQRDIHKRCNQERKEKKKKTVSLHVLYIILHKMNGVLW